MRQDELYHYGVKGMKWKNHKYQKLENGRYVYRTPAEQQLYNARKNYNKSDAEFRDAVNRYNHGDTNLHITANPKTQHEKDAARRESYVYQKVTPKAIERAYDKEIYEQALRKYKKSPMRNMKIAVRVGKARATNAIRNIKGDHYVNPRLQNKKPLTKKRHNVPYKQIIESSDATRERQKIKSTSWQEKRKKKGKTRYEIYKR